MPTLGALLDDRDAQRFIGRRSELAQLEELFGVDSSLRVVHLHGPAGIGKSTLLRELSRRGQAAGWTPRTIEGRDIQPTRTALAEALAGVEDERRPLILFDTYELISGLDGPLRAEILRTLSDDARVVFASRRPPHPGWAQDGWEAVTLDLPVGPLRDADALALLQARGVPEAALAELARDGAGNPLALELLAGSATSGGGDAEDLEATVRTLVGRLAGSELEPLHREVLYISAIARVTTAALIADVLPDHDPVSSLEWLATRSFAEPLGAGFALHDLVRRAVHADLRHRDPERERVLRRRIADHLHARAVAGDTMLSIDLSHLVDNPLLRWGYSWMGADQFSADGLRPGDVAFIAGKMDEAGRAGWWELSEPLCELMPSRVVVVRDLQDAPAGFAITLTPGNAPAAAWDHVHLGPWLRHARDELRTENAVLWQAATVLNPSGNPLIQSMLGMIGVLRSGLRNPRYAYLPINPALPGGVEFVRALGTRHLPELDVEADGQVCECHLLEYGPRGILGLQRDVIYLETGAEPPTDDPFDVPDAVRAALRNLDRPDQLARSPLASGSEPVARAESVRELLRRAIDATFGDGTDERLLHDVMRHGYLDPGVTHEQAADLLHVSRATYFRKLRAATERVCEHMSGAISPR